MDFTREFFLTLKTRGTYERMELKLYYPIRTLGNSTFPGVPLKNTYEDVKKSLPFKRIGGFFLRTPSVSVYGRSWVLVVKFDDLKCLKVRRFLSSIR